MQVEKKIAVNVSDVNVKPLIFDGRVSSDICIFEKRTFEMYEMKILNVKRKFIYFLVRWISCALKLNEI